MGSKNINRSRVLNNGIQHHKRLLRKYLILWCYLSFWVMYPQTVTDNPALQLSKEAKPWTRWWWMGNAVDKANISQQLTAFSKAGIGGVEIEPIYGVQGETANEIEFLSPEWMAMLNHTLYVADSLGMGVDFTLGTGWPYGGPQVTPDHAATKLVVDKMVLAKGAKVMRECVPENKNDRPNAKLQRILAFSESGDYEDLTDQVRANRLYYKSKKEAHTLFFIYVGKTGQMVKRAAPGGAGLTMDHYSNEALKNYVKPFDKALLGLTGRPRAIFNDSYEVYGTDFTPAFFEAFKKRRGYDLKERFNLLMDSTNNEPGNRVKADYRETLGDLLLEEFDRPWSQWAHSHDMKTRLQAHGSPGNLLDLYAAADIPECETFGSMPFDVPGLRRLPENIREGDADPVMLKFASSAAHIAGRPLVSSETFTWLRDHFKTALSHCKPEAEELLLNGVNHIFLHGSTYSPQRAQWPGWKFYASINFNPNNTIWEDAPSLFEYLGRCQDQLQQGRPDNDLLLYWPVHDVWNQYLNAQLFFQFKIHSLNEWLLDTTFYESSKYLMEQGYGVDFVSDRFIESADVKNGEIVLPGGRYKNLVVPKCDHMPLATLQKLVELRAKGASILFEDLPKSVPGFQGLLERNEQLHRLLSENEISAIPKSEWGRELAQVGIFPETLVASGLKYIRRDVDGEKIYFLVNHTPKDIDTLVPLSIKAKEILLFDPLSGESGMAKTQDDADRTWVRLQLPAGRSIFLKTGPTHNALAWNYLAEKGPTLVIGGPWQLEFLKGGPSLPENVALDSLPSWSDLGTSGESFSGTARYSVRFDIEDTLADAWQLDLGDVRESAKVWLNDDYVGTLWANPFTIDLKNLKNGKNTLRIEVTNLAANRIRDKELRGEEWKVFNEINMVDKDYHAFDATKWNPIPSGLLGPVSITPLYYQTTNRK